MTQSLTDRELERDFRIVEKMLLQRNKKRLNQSNQESSLLKKKTQSPRLVTEETTELLIDKVKYLLSLLQDKIPINDIIERNKRVTQILMAIIEETNRISSYDYQLVIPEDKKSENKKRNKLSVVNPDLGGYYEGY